MEKDKVRTVGCAPTRDGRVHVTMQLAATLSRLKLTYIVVVGAAVVLFVLAPFFGWRSDASLQHKVEQLEYSLSRRLSWVASHQKHLKQHLVRRSFEDDEVPKEVRRDDGRRHLWSARGEFSRLAEALVAAGISTTLPPVDDHYMCGTESVTEDDVLRKKLALAAVTWRAPLSLRNSMASWQTNGLLDIVDERMLFINSPTEEDYAIAREYDFDVYTTEEREGNIMAGPSLGYLVGNSSSDYVLFMEKDFVLSSDRDTMLKEMYASVHAMARGVEVYRLRGKSDHPAEGMPDCCAKSDPPQCPFNSAWASAGYFSDHMNWLRIFCVDDPVADGRGQVVKCTSASASSSQAGGELESGPGTGTDGTAAEAGPPPETAVDTYCFSAGNSNWSNNPVVFPVKWFNDKLKEVAFLDWERNNMFEFNVMMNWLSWRPAARVCVSYQGIFKHWEVDQ